jgi:hypothetical protein
MEKKLASKLDITKHLNKFSKETILTRLIKDCDKIIDFMINLVNIYNTNLLKMEKFIF